MPIFKELLAFTYFFNCCKNLVDVLPVETEVDILQGYARSNLDLLYHSKVADSQFYEVADLGPTDIAMFRILLTHAWFNN